MTEPRQAPIGASSAPCAVCNEPTDLRIVSGDGRVPMCGGPCWLAWPRVKALLAEHSHACAALASLRPALALLRRLDRGGSIVSSAGLTPTQIAIARAADRVWVDANGYGHVYVPGPASPISGVAGDSCCAGNECGRLGCPECQQ